MKKRAGMTARYFPMRGIAPFRSLPPRGAAESVAGLLQSTGTNNATGKSLKISANGVPSRKTVGSPVNACLSICRAPQSRRNDKNRVFPNCT